MDVEHRCAPRQAADLEVMLRTRSRGLQRCRVRDVAAGGMFVEYEGALPALCTVVEVVLSQAAGTVTRVQSWRAMVVHRQASGIGLMFDRVRRDEVAELLGSLPMSRAAGARAMTVELSATG